MTAAKWTLYLLIALSGTIAQREIYELWTPHKVRNLVWTSRGDGKHYRRAVRDLEKVHRELLRFFRKQGLTFTDVGDIIPIPGRAFIAPGAFR